MRLYPVKAHALICGVIEYKYMKHKRQLHVFPRDFDLEPPDFASSYPISIWFSPYDQLILYVKHIQIFKSPDQK